MLTNIWLQWLEKENFRDKNVKFFTWMSFDTAQNVFWLGFIMMLCTWQCIASIRHWPDESNLVVIMPITRELAWEHAWCNGLTFIVRLFNVSSERLAVLFVGLVRDDVFGLVALVVTFLIYYIYINNLGRAVLSYFLLKVAISQEMSLLRSDGKYSVSFRRPFAFS